MHRYNYVVHCTCSTINILLMLHWSTSLILVTYHYTKVTVVCVCVCVVKKIIVSVPDEYSLTSAKSVRVQPANPENCNGVYYLPNKPCRSLLWSVPLSVTRKEPSPI